MVLTPTKKNDLNTSPSSPPAPPPPPHPTTTTTMMSPRKRRPSLNMMKSTATQRRRAENASTDLESASCDLPQSSLPASRQQRDSSCRCLFGKPDPEELRRDLEDRLRLLRAQSAARWEFDFDAGLPLRGDDVTMDWTQCGGSIEPTVNDENLPTTAAANGAANNNFSDDVSCRVNSGNIGGDLCRYATLQQILPTAVRRDTTLGDFGAARTSTRNSLAQRSSSASSGHVTHRTLVTSSVVIRRGHQRSRQCFVTDYFSMIKNFNSNLNKRS